jgi:CheY-like chemotaxis protein
MKSKTTRKIRMLLVEDSLLHQQLTKRALQATELEVELDIASDGSEALAYLNERGVGTEALRHLPDMILLDINMPGMDGLELLREIKNNPALRAIPIAMLTTSEAPRDIRAAYERGANAYLAKPDGFHEFREMLKELGQFWLKRAKLPRHGK